MAGLEDLLAGRPGEVVDTPPTEPIEPTEGGQSAAQAGNPTEQNVSFFEQINKRKGTAYKSDDELFAALDSTARIAELETKAQEAESFKTKAAEYDKSQKEWLAEKAKLEARINPLSHFRDEKAYVAEQLRKQFPDRDPVVIEKLVTSDLTRMDKVELLAHEMLLNTPDIDGGLEGARELVYSKYGIEAGSNPEEWDRVVKNKITVEAKEAQSRLQQFQKSVEIPKVKTEEDIAAEATQRAEGLKKSWSPFLDRIEAMDKINIPDPTDASRVLETIDIPEAWRKEAREGLLDSILAGEIDPSEDAIKALVIEREKDFIHGHLPQIFTIWANKIKTQSIEERDKLLNNTQPPNDTVAPDDVSTTGGGMAEFLNH